MTIHVSILEELTCQVFAHVGHDISQIGYSTTEDVMENLLVIDILFSSMQVSEIREIVTYGWGNFLGEC